MSIKIDHAYVGKKVVIVYVSYDDTIAIFSGTLVKGEGELTGLYMVRHEYRSSCIANLVGDIYIADSRVVGIIG